MNENSSPISSDQDQEQEQQQDYQSSDDYVKVNDNNQSQEEEEQQQQQQQQMLPISQTKEMAHYNGIMPWDFSRTGASLRREQIKIAFMTLTLIAPIRFLLFLILGILGALPCWIMVSIYPKNQPLPHDKFRTFISNYLRIMARILLFVAGFYTLPVISSPNSDYKTDNTHNTPNNNFENARILVCNHVTIWDGFMLYYLTGCSVIVKQTLMNVPILNSLLKGLQCIGIERKSPEGRILAKETILRQVEDQRYPPLLIFPQGTTTLHNVCTLWKTGAFTPALPVQPVIIHYLNKHGVIDFVDQTLLFSLYYTACQFVNYAKIEFMDIYKPNVNEKKNALLFTNNVRKEYISNVCDIIATNHSFEDYNLLFKLSQTKIEFEHLVLHDFYQMYDLPLSLPIKLLSTFVKFDESNSGSWNQNEFIRFFGFNRNENNENNENSENSDKINENINENSENFREIVEKKSELSNYMIDCLSVIYGFIDSNNNNLIEFDEYLVLIAILLCEKNIEYLISIYYYCLIGNNSNKNDKMIVLENLIEILSNNKKDNKDTINENERNNLIENLQKLREILINLTKNNNTNNVKYKDFYNVMINKFSLMRSINSYILKNYCQMLHWDAVNTRCV